ncbi:hypothetical protein OROMI_019859 [Orobanche minor]
MDIDRSWMDLPRLTKAYQNGVQLFLNFALSNSEDGLISCPCKECKNGICRKPEIVEAHLITKGFVKGYTKWVLHGESLSNSVHVADSFAGGVATSDDMMELLSDRFPMLGEDNLMGDEETPNPEAEKFYRLLKDAEQELYPGCKNFSKLSFLVRMLQIKALGNWSDKSFSMMLDLLKESFPEGVHLPKNYYETRKTLRDLGLDYQKIDSCTNDCMIYWDVNESKSRCDTCGLSRWKEVENSNMPGADKSKKTKKKLFMTPKIASMMTWHANERTEDGIMRHPADSPVWQTFDYNHPDFAKEPRNVRLGLTADGFTPFRSMMVNHSTWPVVLMPYKLPPGECMKKSYFMLSILIPGPHEPGNNIDVYLQPLIEELKLLWDVGIDTFDAPRKENFQLRAALLWTISDLPGLANLSGWSTKGKYACPVCLRHTNSEYLKNSHKPCYMSHRIFLPSDHPFRNDTHSFDGNEEHREAPSYPTSSEIFDEVKDLENKFGKLVGDQGFPYNWKKRSIFYELPYWESNLLRHNLDLMHIEKAVCDKLAFTFLGSDKSKDNINARLDLKDKGIRPELHPFVDGNGKEWIPASCFELDKKEKLQFCKVLKSVKVPDGYASNISKNVQLKPPKIFISKSHDSHILMQQLLPIALRNLLPDYVRAPVLRLCKYFRELCPKTLNHLDLVRMEGDIAVTLCQLEKIFPPSFFDLTVHVTIHLVTEAKLGGPVYYRWMYPPERQYLDENVETRQNRTGRNEDRDFMINEGLQIFSKSGHPLWKGEPVVLDKKTLEKAHRYVLFNCEEIKSKLDEHESIIRRKKRRSQEHDNRRTHSQEFSLWFCSQVLATDNNDSTEAIQNDISYLAKGPVHTGKRYKGFIINGFRFNTRETERNRKTQNSGVEVSAATTSFASKKDKRPISSELTYYGIVKDIIELYYSQDKRVVLFECDWVTKGRRLKQDTDGFTLANFANIKRHDEPFVLASQVQQVFYVHDPSDKDWHVVIRTKARHNVEDGSDLPTEIDAMLQSAPCNEVSVDEIEDISWVHDGAPPTIVKMSKKTISTNSLLQMVKKQRNSFANTVHTKAQLSSDDDYQGDRNMADPVNAQPNHHRVGTNQQSAYSGPTNKHVSLGTHQQMSDNIDDAVQDWIDDEVQDWNAFPEENYVAVPRITRSQRTMNNNQRKQSVLVDEQMPPGNVNDAPDVEHDLRDDLFEKSRARGYTYMPHVWAISSKDSNLKRLPIEFYKYGKPIGPNKSRFVEFLGTIVRNGNKAPLNYETWHNMPISFKDDMLEKVKVMRPDMFDERVKDDHWKFLVEHWCKDKTKEMSKKNKENRAMKKMQHITGKRSFAQVYEMEMAKRKALRDVGLGENDTDEDENIEETELARANIFEQCYSRDGNTSNPVVANALEKMQLLKSQLAPGEKDEGPNDIFSQVLGNDKGGRVRMFGSGITTKRIYGGDSLGHDDIHQIIKENERLEKELERKNMIIERLMRNADLRGHPDIVDISSMSPARNSQLEKSGKPSSHVHFFQQEKNYAPTKSSQTLDPASCAHTKSAKTLNPTNSAQTLVPVNCARTTVQSFEHDQSSAPTKLFRPPAFAKFTPPTASLQSTKTDQSSAPIRSALTFDTIKSFPRKSPAHTSATSLQLQIGAQVLLRSLLNNDYVAKGVILSLSPSKLVGNEELGAAWCEVKVTVGIKLDEKLIRTIGSVKKIGQVIGRSVAWPKHLVNRDTMK